MKRQRDPEDKAARLIAAVGEALTEHGYQGLGMNKITFRAGVSKPMVYAYFGSLNGLVKAYVKQTDSWLPSFASLDLPEQPTVEALKQCFIQLLQGQLRFFYGNKELQRLVLWQVSEYNALMRTACDAREKEGARLLELTDAHFRNSGVSLRAVLALLVGGVYFNVLHDTADAGTMAGINLKDEKDFESMLETIGQVIGWAFDEAGQK